jgi:AcrR family transcriptional regulator
MEDVAQAAGLSRKTIYRVFASRSDLFNAVVMDRANEFIERLRAIDWSAHR